MDLNHDQCYEIIKAQDSRFDGVFFTGVKTTGIYCRPVCRVPAPKSENCTFFSSAWQAEQAGFRPCLRCRPELAPAYNEFRQGDLLIRQILEGLDHLAYRPGAMKQLAEDLGVSSRHMQRIFQDHLGISPSQYIKSKRLLMAKTFLMDTSLPVSEIAYLSGFGSLSAFNRTWKAAYGLPPSRLRKKALKEEWLTLYLRYRPPYAWEQMMTFYRLRAIEGLEEVTDQGEYRRGLIINLENRILRGWIGASFDPDDDRLVLRVSRSLEAGLLQVIRLVRRAFDLDCNPEGLPAGISRGSRLPVAFNDFEIVVRAIVGQQISVSGAQKILNRLVAAYGHPLESPFQGISLSFPSPGDFCKVDDIEQALGRLGVIKTRSRLIQTLAGLLSSKELSLGLGQDIEALRQDLLSIKGLGPWTADYLLMRGVGWPDAFPYGDAGVKQGLKQRLLDDRGIPILDNPGGLSKYQLNKAYESQAMAYADQYRPWRSYLTMSLWWRLEA